MQYFQWFLDGVVPAFLCQKDPESGNKAASTVPDRTLGCGRKFEERKSRRIKHQGSKNNRCKH